MPCNKLAVGEGQVTVDPNILHENPQAKIALAALAIQAVKSAYATFRPAQAEALAAKVDEGAYAYSAPGRDGNESVAPGCYFYPNGWRTSGFPEWYLGPVTIRLRPDGSLEYRDGDWISGTSQGKFTQEELQHFITLMDEQIPQLASIATVESIAQQIATIAPVQSDQWVSPTVRVVTLTL